MLTSLTVSEAQGSLQLKGSLEALTNISFLAAVWFMLSSGLNPSLSL